MLTKVLSLVTGIATLDVYLQSLRSSNDPLFAVISGNLVINILMLSLVALAIVVSFRKKFITWEGYTATTGLAVTLIALGSAGILFSGFSSLFWTIFMPLNYLLMLDVGIVLAISSLSYKHPARPAHSRLPRPALPFKVAFPVPKILHSPGLGRSVISRG